jgi:hypothetical protein
MFVTRSPFYIITLICPHLMHTAMITILLLRQYRHLTVQLNRIYWQYCNRHSTRSELVIHYVVVLKQLYFHDVRSEWNKYDVALTH